MRQYPLRPRWFPSLLLVLTLSACSAPASAPAPAPRGEGAASLLASLRTLAASVGCTDASQCKSIAIGARACGGPEAYLAYSTALTDPAQLQALALRHAEQRRIEVASSGMLSTCAMLPDPGATCRAGACRLRSATTDPS